MSFMHLIQSETKEINIISYYSTFSNLNFVLFKFIYFSIIKNILIIKI